jgi:hypothetical protein
VEVPLSSSTGAIVLVAFGDGISPLAVKVSLSRGAGAIVLVGAGGSIS